MSAVLSEEQLDYLRSIDSPTVANAIEIFDIRPRTEGYMTPDIKARFPELGPVVGYAVTAKISAKKPSGTPVSRSDFLDYVLSLPAPRVVVIDDRYARDGRRPCDGRYRRTSFRCLLG